MRLVVFEIRQASSEEHRTCVRLQDPPSRETEVGRHCQRHGEHEKRHDRRRYDEQDGPVAAIVRARSGAQQGSVAVLRKAR